MDARKIYVEYRSEMFFLLLLSAAVVVSYIITPYIPVRIYQYFLGPMLNCFLINFCFGSAWILLRHHDGLRVRKLVGWSFVVWTAIMTFGLIIRVLGPFGVADGLFSIHGWEMVFANVLAWLLLAYPTEILRPGWLNWKIGSMQLIPIFVVGILDHFVPLDLRWLLVIYPTVLSLSLIQKIRSYRIWVENNYSSMDNVDVQWIWRYIGMLFIVGASYTYMTFLNTPTRLFTQEWLILFFLMYSTEQIMYRPNPWAVDETNESSKKALKAKAHAETVPAEVVTNEQEAEVLDEETAVKEDEMESVDEKVEANKALLEQWMESEKPYLSNEFRLTDLRQVLPMNRTYLSQFINNAYGCTFYQFVTNYRVKEAKEMMRSHPEMLISEVGEKCGFSSPTMFGRVFARETGYTPSEWSSNSDLA